MGDQAAKDKRILDVVFERQQTSNEIMEGAHVDRLARTGTGVRRHRMTLFNHSSTKHACDTKL